MSNMNSGFSQFVNPKNDHMMRINPKTFKRSYKVQIPIASIVFLFVCFGYNICK
jgi:hypothetical protein